MTAFAAAPSIPRPAAARRLVMLVLCLTLPFFLVTAALAQPQPPADEPAPAAPLEPLRLDLDAERGSWMLSADLDVPWSPALQDAVRRGVALYFVLEFELLQPRWYWTDRTVIERSKVTRLAWHALTRQYRVTADGLTQTWDTLADALDTMRKVRHWRVFDAASAAAGSTYVARIRLRLDTSQLPKPLQLNAMTDRDWNPPAEWRRTGFQP